MIPAKKSNSSTFTELHKRIVNNIGELGMMLTKMKEERLFLEGGFKTFKEYAESLGKNYHWAWRQMASAKVAEQLDVPVPNVATAQAIAKVPQRKREAVVSRAFKATEGRLSAPAIQSAAKPPQRPPIKPPVVERPTHSGIKDGTGLEVPIECLEMWNRGPEAQELLTTISRLKSTLKKAHESKDPFFGEVDFNDAIAKLTMLYENIKGAKPFAVCPDCNGVIKGGCPECRYRGFISEFRWFNCIPEEKRKMRE